MLAAFFRERLLEEPAKWLVTGVAGFVGSHLLEELLKHGQQVVGLDNFSTGSQNNLEEVRKIVGANAYSDFHLIEGDIRDITACRAATRDCKYVLHQAALASVPQSLDNPLLTHEVNETGFIQVLLAARENRVKKVVYASSCAIYGDNSNLPLGETEHPSPISPYAASKVCNEIYARAFHESYGMDAIGLRYFNIFGERQDPNGAYAAVIPRWIMAGISGDRVFVNGDGHQTRDFVYVKNIVHANIAAAMAQGPLPSQAMNVASGQRLSLNELLAVIQTELERQRILDAPLNVSYREGRKGDIKHSVGNNASIASLKAFHFINLHEGIQPTIKWYIDHLNVANQNSVPEIIRPIEGLI